MTCMHDSHFVSDKHARILPEKCVIISINQLECDFHSVNVGRVGTMDW